MGIGIKITISFVVGLLIGIAGTGIYIHHCFSCAWNNTGNHKHTLEVLDSKLDLTPDQKTKIENIFEAASPSMEKIRLETDANLKIIRDQTSSQIRLLLNENQQKKFDILKAKWDKKSNSKNNEWHIPGLPPGGPPSLNCLKPVSFSNSLSSISNSK